MIVLLLIGAVIFHVVVLLSFLHYTRRSTEALEKLAHVLDGMDDLRRWELEYQKGISNVGGGLEPPCQPPPVEGMGVKVRLR